MTKHFMFHISWISILKFLYFNLFSDSFCITFLSDSIATSISKQILSLLLLLLLSSSSPSSLSSSYYLKLVRTTNRANMLDWLKLLIFWGLNQSTFGSLNGKVNLLPKLKFVTKLLRSRNLSQKPLKITFILFLTLLFKLQIILSLLVMILLIFRIFGSDVTHANTRLS
jgi:hypothetical protein